MLWRKIRILVFLACLVILLTGADGCCPKEAEEEVDKFLKNEASKRNININSEIKTENINGFINYPPEISGLQYTQIHLTYEETPHKYKLTATASDPNEEDLLHYYWGADCGYFPFQEEKSQGIEEDLKGYTTDNTVEWWYDEPGECLEAKITVWVQDFFGQEVHLTKKIFEE
jgi:hypothetical protein